MKKSLLLGFVLLFTGCGCGPIQTKQPQSNFGPEVFNVEHDGHKFIVFRHNTNIHVLLHPTQLKVEKE